METQKKLAIQLNKDVKNLVASISKCSKENELNLDRYFDFLNTVAKVEFERIYNEDRTFTLLNKNNVLNMFRLNIKHRFLPFHSFGIHIDIN
jgi:hypothetical protein